MNISSFCSAGKVYKNLEFDTNYSFNSVSIRDSYAHFSKKSAELMQNITRKAVKSVYSVHCYVQIYRIKCLSPVMNL